MSLIRASLAFAACVTIVEPAPAGIFSRNKPAANPAERVPELLTQIRSDRDEAKRAAAAEELRQYDPKAFPEIVTALVDALTKDASTSVRSEAASSLGKLRPVTQRAGYALEQSTANDGSMRVRMAARQALWQYHLVGYRSGKPPEAQAKAADGKAGTTPPAATRTSARLSTGPFRETPEPPLADPATVPAPVVGRPLPAGPRVPQPAPAIPVTAPKQASPIAAPAALRRTPKSADAPKPAAPGATSPRKGSEAAPVPPTVPPATGPSLEGPELPF